MLRMTLCYWEKCGALRGMACEHLKCNMWHGGGGVETQAAMHPVEWGQDVGS